MPNAESAPPCAASHINGDAAAAGDARAGASSRRRRTKIVATLGPASAAPATVAALLRAGVNVVRINASHGNHAAHAKNIATVRDEASKLARPVAILFDLQGPKIRVGAFEGPAVSIARGQIFTLAVNRPPEGDELPADYAFLDRDVSVGDPLLIDDGGLATEVVSVAPTAVRCRALHAGEIKQRKGINLPNSAVSAPAVTEKDRRDAAFAVAQGVDMVAMSFVRRAQDLADLRAVLTAAGGSDLPIIAKIEKTQALDNLEAILAASWGVMVARGDLGVELSAADVPMAQKRIIRLANRLSKPVITATQMLDSMTRNPQPTRAEASDVANAVLDGTDAVMLSQETASGTYPVETVAMMGRIIDAVERHGEADPSHRRRERSLNETPPALAYAGCEVAYHVHARALAVFTETGRMALLTSQRRPPAPIMAFAADRALCNRLCLVWGVYPVLQGRALSLKERVEEVEATLVDEGLAQGGDPFVLLAGSINAPTGSTNLLLVHRVGRPPAPVRLA